MGNLLSEFDDFPKNVPAPQQVVQESINNEYEDPDLAAAIAASLEQMQFDQNLKQAEEESKLDTRQRVEEIKK